MRIASCSVLFVAAAFLAGCNPQAAKDLQMAKSQVNTWVERLDTQTTKTGVYVRHQDEVLPEVDPWGNKLRVSYSQGGLAEIVKVSSAGPDGMFGNDDDIREERQTTNLAGVGEGLKSGAQDLANESAKGVVKGVVAGVKESLPKFGKKGDDAELPEAPANEPEESTPE